MERESSSKKNSIITTTTSINHHQHRQPIHHRERISLGIGADTTLKTRSSSSTLHQETPDFVLQWGNKKRLRRMKIQTKDEPVNRTTARVDRRVIRTDVETTILNQHRPLRTSENMKGSLQGHGTNSVLELSKVHTHEGRRVGPASASNHHHPHHNNIGNDVVFEAANEEGSKKGGGSSSGSEVIPPAVWPPKFVIALTNKEKEEDFMAIKGSKLPQRPKKRSKYVQRNLKLVSPGAWLCDLTLDRYEVREKKTSKKRPRGLKAMCSTSIDSESE